MEILVFFKQFYTQLFLCQYNSKPIVYQFNISPNFVTIVVKTKIPQNI